MKKYLKITIVLFSICLVCALAVAGVNTFTAPKIEEYQNQLKMEAYQGLFTDMDANTSIFTEDGFKSSYVKDKVEAKNASGETLGYGFQVTGSNQFGSITLVVALNQAGQLIGVTCTSNTESYATKMEGYDEKFTAGMTVTDVQNVAVCTGATYGSNLFKNLIVAAFSEAGIMTEIQKTLVGIFGDNVDMAQTVEKTSLIYAQQVETGYTVKDSAGTVLGYYYVVNMSNRFGNINVAVSLNPDFTVKQIDQIDVTQRPYGQDPNKTDTTQIAKDFISGIQAGSSYDDVNGLATVSKATISTTSAKAAILVAIKEAQNTFDESLALRIMFYNYANVTEVTEGKLDTVDKYQDVTKEDGTSLGKAVVVNGTNTYGNIKLYIGINSSNALAGIFILENTQTAGRADSLTNYLPEFTSGMTGMEAISVPNYSGASFASTTTKDLIATAFEQVTGERPSLGYDSYYEAAFEGVDLSKSTDITEFKSENISEGKVLCDASGNILGYAYVISSTNEMDGELTLMVAVQPSGKLQGVQDINNAQTGTATGLLDDYYTNFTAGMSSADVNNVSSVSGATIGSNQYKTLVTTAMAEVETYNGYYEDIFGEDVTFEEISSLNREEIIQGVKVTKDETILGYAYIIRLENPYGYNVMCVALNANGTFKKLVDVENNHANLTDIATVFEDGSNMEQIIAQGNSDKAIEIGASYTSEIATLGIKIAMDACSGNLTESVSDEIYIKTLFSYAVMRRCEELETITNSPITKAYKVVGVSNFVPGQTLGYVYFITVENEDILMSLVVGVDTNHNYVGSIITKYETKVSHGVDGSFKDSLKDKVTSYLIELVGMSDTEIKNAPYYETASYASQLVKYALRLCVAESNNVVMTKPNLYSDNQIYLNAIEGLDLTSVTRIDSNTFLYPNIISGIRLADGSQAYIVDVINGYSHNYILVYVDSSNKLISLYDVENNHGAIGSVSSLFTNGMTLEQVEEIKYNIQSDASFTIEMTKLAIRMVMTQAMNSENNEVVYENAAKEIFPLMVMGRSEVVTPTNQDIAYGIKAVGVIGYTNGQTLGYAFAIDGVMIGVNTLGAYAGYYVFGDATEAAKSFYASLTNGMTYADVNALTGDESAKANVLAVLDEARQYTNLTAYDSYILDVFPDYAAASSELTTDNVKNKKEILAAVNVKDVNGDLLGYAFAIYLANAYGTNTMLIALNVDGTFNKALDIANTHSNIDSWQNENKDIFVSGMTAEDIENIRYDNVSDGSFTIESIKLAIKIAMNEVAVDGNTSAYEAAAKKIFPGMVAGRSTVLTEFKNSNVLYGYQVVGATGQYDGNPTSQLGYVYIIKLENAYGYNVMAVGLNTDGTFKALVDVDNNHADLTEIAGVFEEGSTMEQIIAQGNSDDAITIGASFTSEIATLGIKIAMNEVAETVNNEIAYEMYAKQVFSYMVLRRSEKLSTLPANVTFGYKVVGVANFQAGKDLGYFFVISGSNKYGTITLGVGIDTTGKLAGIAAIEINQTGGRAQKIKDYLTQFTAGMTADEVAALGTVADATLGSNVVKEILANAFAAYTSLTSTEGGSN